LKFTAIIAATGVLAIGMATGTQDTKSFVGKPMPKFALTTVQGASLTNENLRGKPVLFDFWATWCGPCKAAAPHVQAIYEKYKARGLVVIGANVFEGRGGQPTGPKPALDYATEHKYTYAFTYDSDALAKALAVNGIPTFVLMDPKGTIDSVWVGFGKNTGEQIEARVQTMLPK